MAAARVPDPTPKPAVQMTYLIKQLELAVRKQLDRAVRPFGLTTPQFTALSSLVRHPGMSSAQLARRSFVSPQAASEMVVALERKQLIARVAQPSNARVLGLHLTDTGRAVLADCAAAAAGIESLMLSDLDGAEQAGLRSMLDRCLAAMTPAPPALLQRDGG